MKSETATPEHTPVTGSQPLAPLPAQDGVHKNVTDFLEEKRSHFPRFYFLSNKEMVDILVRWAPGRPAPAPAWRWTR